jgi:hypothetical protein
LERWMRMVTIPNQSSVAKAFDEFDAAGRMRPSSYYDRIVDVMEELARFTVLLRPHTAQTAIAIPSERRRECPSMLQPICPASSSVKRHSPLEHVLDPSVALRLPTSFYDEPR